MDGKFLNITLQSNNKIVEIGKDKQFKLIAIEGIESSDFELNVTENSQFDGATLNGKRIKARPISIVAEISNSKNSITERKNIISFFNPRKDGELFINYCGLEYKIDYNIESFKARIVNINDPLQFTLDLLCCNPYLTDLAESRTDVALWQNSFNFEFELIEGGIELGYRQPTLIVNVINLGDVECGMKIEFKARGSVVNPSLTNANTLEFIKINKTLVAGETITVYTYLGGKKVESTITGVTTNAINYLDFESTFLQLDTNDNLLRYDAETGIDNLDCTIYYNQQYLGV